VGGAVSGDLSASFGTVNVSELGSYLVPAGAGYALLTAASGADSASFAAVNFSDAALTTAYAPGSATLNVGQLFYTLWNVDTNGDWSVASKLVERPAERGGARNHRPRPAERHCSIQFCRDGAQPDDQQLSIRWTSRAHADLERGINPLANGSTLMLTGGTLVDNAGLTVDWHLFWSGGSVLTGAGMLTTTSTAWTGITGTTFLTDKSWNNAGTVNINWAAACCKWTVQESIPSPTRRAGW